MTNDLRQLGSCIKDNILNKLIILISCCLLLSACDQSASTSGATNLKAPSSLRAIPTENLIAQVTIDGQTTSYFGRDYPDNNWLISLPIELNKEYTLSIEWFSSSVLLAVQEGQLIARNYDDTVSPTLTEISSGEPRFNNNCNEFSNLQELENGTDPGLPGDPACGTEILFSNPVNVVEPADVIVPANADQIITAVISQPFGRFDQHPANMLPTNRVTHFTQPIKVQTSSVSISNIFGATIWTAEPSQITIDISLFSDSNSNRFARFGGSGNGITVAPETIANANCDTGRATRPVCTIPFSWQDQQWYELVFEEDGTDNTRWNTSIIDPASGAETILGTFITPANTLWVEPTIAIVYPEAITASACADGLPPITMHFRGGTANRLFTLDGPTRTFDQDCIRWGAGASTSLSTNTSGAGSDVFMLTLGR